MTQNDTKGHESPFWCNALKRETVIRGPHVKALSEALLQLRKTLISDLAVRAKGYDEHSRGARENMGPSFE